MVNKLIERNRPDERVIICTDSRSNLQALEKSKLIFEDSEDALLRERIKILTDISPHVRLQFVRGHNGLTGNEI